jgi:uncharacterized protein YcbK (DUF882 family)
MGSDWGAVVREFSRRVRLLRAQGYRQTSGLRDPFKNRAVKGNPRSQHLIGTAADFSVQGMSKNEVLALMSNARKLGLVAVGPDAEQQLGHPPHVHVQAFPAGTIPQKIYTQRIGLQIQEIP